MVLPQLDLVSRQGYFYTALVAVFIIQPKNLNFLRYEFNLFRFIVKLTHIWKNSSLHLMLSI